MQDPVQRQEGILQDVTQRVRQAEETASAATQCTEGVRAVIAADQTSINKAVKRLNNAMTKIAELEEEVRKSNPCVFSSRGRPPTHPHRTAARLLQSSG